MSVARADVRRAIRPIRLHRGEQCVDGSVSVCSRLLQSRFRLQRSRLQQHGCLPVSSCRRMSPSCRRQVLWITCHSSHRLQGSLSSFCFFLFLICSRILDLDLVIRGCLFCYSVYNVDAVHFPVTLFYYVFQPFLSLPCLFLYNSKQNCLSFYHSLACNYIIKC